MVTVYGLNKEIGNVTYYDSSGNDGFVKPYSEETGKKIDEEISMMIEAQYERAIQILEGNKDKLTVLADLLLEKEVIFKDDLEKIFGKRPFEDVVPVTESKEKKVIKEEEEIQSVAEPTEE
jgi:ATP-dependent Zn protease